MKNIYLICAFFLNFVAILHAGEALKSSCSEKDKTFVLFETAENFLRKARAAYPSCKNNSNSTDQCDSEKSLAYFKIAKKLICDVSEDFPPCSNTTGDDDQHTIKEEKYSDCSELLAAGRNKSGVYTILPTEFPTERPLKAYCDMETDGGGWTVIQRRGKFPFQQDFYKDFDRYKNGFGKLTQEFWFGNENIRVLCLRGCKIRFDLEDENGIKFYAVYEDFSLSSNKYRINIDGFSGNATDAMKSYNEFDFQMKYYEEAKKYHSGWWFAFPKPIIGCNLNGLYEPGKSGKQYVYWSQYSNDFRNLASVEIKVKPNYV